MAITLHTALLVALIALQVADAALTINIMRLGGRETNKLLILMIGRFGRDAVLVGSKLALIAALFSAIDVSDQEPFVAMARVGVQIVQRSTEIIFT